MHQLRLLALAVLTLLTAPAWGEQVRGLYEAEVALDAGQLDNRGPAVREGLATVLVKLGGSRQVLESPVVSEALAHAGDYLLQFFFKRADWPLREGEAEPAQLLRMSFQPAAVQAILRNAGVPVLSPNRPAVLLWLLLDDGSGQRIVNPETDASASAWMDMHAMRRALPVLYPALDLEDAAALDTAQLGVLDREAVSSASSRYGAAVLAMARLTRPDPAGVWQGEWGLRIGEEWLDGGGEAPGLDVLQGQLADFIAEAISGRYAIQASMDDSRQLRLRIDGVGSFASYRQIELLLKSLVSVRELHVVLLDKDTVIFELLSDTALDSLRQELGLLPQLQLVGDPGDLRYQWIGG